MMASVMEDGGNQEPVVDASDLELELNRSELLGDEYLNISGLFPENTVFLTPNSPEQEAAESNAGHAGREPTVPSETPYYPGATSFDQNEQQTNQDRPISPLPILDFSCLTIGGQTLDDPLAVYNTLEPFIPDQPDQPPTSNAIDDLNLSQTKFDELHSPRPSPSPEEESCDAQSMEIESSILAEPALTPAVSPVEPVEQPPIQIAISIAPTGAIDSQTVQWSMMIPAGDATATSSVPVDQTTTTTTTQPAEQQSILIYNPHATGQESAITSVEIAPPPKTVDLSLQNMLVAAARRKQAKSSPVRHTVIPVVAYSRDQLTVIPTATTTTSSNDQSCAEFFSNFTDEAGGEDHPMGNPAEPSSPAPSGYVEIPSDYVVSSNGKQQVFKVHELYKTPLLHPLVVEEQVTVVNNSAQVTEVPPKAKKRSRRTDVNYATGFACGPCQKTFGKKGSLEQHKRSHHAEPRPHLCKKCGKSFPTPEKLFQHEQNHLPGNKRFECSDCEKRYVHAKDRDRHYLAHHGTGTFRCEECPKAFARRDHLLAHVISHRKRRERAARKEAEKAIKQAEAKEKAAKKARRNSAAAAANPAEQNITESSSDSYADFISGDSSCEELLRKISLNNAAAVAN